jgi:serine/threonine-protein kinase
VSSPLSVPPHIGRFRVIEFLGQGAMGVVYRGRDEGLERDVALKVMSMGQGADQESRERFRREAQAAARLQHPNIITIYELGEHQGAPFMALELLEGVDLQRAIEGGLRPDPRVTLPIVLQLVAGLGHAHEHGIIHRDVKPSNVFLPRGRPAKIMDFGVARLSGNLTTTGMVVGTPNYMSPEQVRAGKLDGRSDLFSAGLILHELVTGEKAYRGDSVVSLMFKIAHEPPTLSPLPRAPEWDSLRRILATALAHDPDARYPDARSMAADLARALQELGGSPDWAAPSDIGLMVRATPRPGHTLGTTAPPLAPPVNLGTLPDSPTAPALTAAPPRSSLSFVAAGLGAVAIAILALTTAVWMRGREIARPTDGTVSARPSAVPGTAALASPSSAEPLSATSASPPLPSARPPSALVPPTGTLPPAPLSLSPSPREPTPAASLAPSPSPAPIENPSTAETQSALPPDPADARLERANDLMDRGRFAAALAEAKAVLQREPRNAAAKALAEDAESQLVVESRIQKAREALKRGDRDEALEEIKAGLALNPSDSRLLALFKEAVQ